MFGVITLLSAVITVLQMCGIAESVNDTSNRLTVFADRGLIFVVRQRWGYAEHDTAVGFMSIQKRRDT